jgi:hypothetical protein
MIGVVDRAADFLSKRVDRRGFLGKSAVVGSAVVAAPLDFGLKPTSAYAAVCSCNGSSCSCGSMCCDGYTEFCCTLNGKNACPPGTVTAGWWKVDGSNFCGGAARYYLDCNAQCGGCSCGANGVCSGSCSGTGCGCARGNCGNRKAGCTRFRYGQCNQQIRCVGPIVCRVVTCSPPWNFDPACGTSSRTDNATRYHDRPCLNQPTGSLELVQDVGGAVRVKGWAVSNLDYSDAVVRLFVDSKVVTEVRANQRRPDVQLGTPAYGSTTGFDFRQPLQPGRRLICVFAVDRRNGRQTALGAREINVSGPIGQVSHVGDLANGRVLVQGWAIDNTFKSHPPLMRYRVDGREVARKYATVERPDIVAFNPSVHPKTGFSVQLPAGAGARRVCVDVINRYGFATQIGCVTVNTWPNGNVEEVTALGSGRVRVKGWALDRTARSTPAMVRYRVDGTEVARARTAVARPDVRQLFGLGPPNPGFQVDLDVPPGARNICVDLVESGGRVRPLSCRSVDVS